MQEDDSVGNFSPIFFLRATIQDFHLLKVIGKGSFGKVLLAKHKESSKYYAIKVLQKQSIMKRNEVESRQ